MKDQESDINIKISNKSQFDKSLRAKFEDYEIKYKEFSVIWEIKNSSLSTVCGIIPTKPVNLNQDGKESLRKL